jgi:hypothetical protein
MHSVFPLLHRPLLVAFPSISLLLPSFSLSPSHLVLQVYVSEQVEEWVPMDRVDAEMIKGRLSMKNTL